MKDGQKEIYYLVALNREAIESGPYLEGFKARNLEVLFCHEPVDEYVFNNVREFEGKKFLAADHADVKLDDVPQQGEALAEAEVKDLAKWLQETLGTQVSEVKASDRPTSS
jgi:TNF receptor-associated protein 1